MGQLHIVLVRHAPRVKGKDEITSKGKTRGSALGAVLRSEHPNAAFTARYSETERAHQTALAILAGADANEAIRCIEPDPRLNDVSSEAFDEIWTNLRERERDAGVNYYLHFGDTKPDAGTLSPREAAGRVASLLLKVIGDPHPQGEADSVCAIMVTHSGVVESFLACVLGFRDVRVIGGMFDYLDGVRCVFDCDAPERAEGISGRLIFRSFDHPLAFTRLQALANAPLALPSVDRHYWQLSRQEIYSPQAIYGFRLSPDGRQLAFIGQRDQRVEMVTENGRSTIEETSIADLYLLSRTGGYPRQLSDSGDVCQPAAWSPDGKWLAVERGDGLEVRPVAGGATTQIYRGTLYHPPVETGDAYLAGPRWSPDGAALIFTVREDSQSMLREVSQDGRSRQDMLAVDGYILSWDWSPDGQKIVLVTREEDGWVGDIRVLDRKTGKVRILAQEQDYEYQKPAAVWARDGECIVTRSNISGWSKLWVLSPEDGSGRQLTTGDWDDYAYRIAPDGEQLVYASRAEHDGSGDDLWIRTLKDGDPRRLTHQKGIQVPLAWSKDNRIYYWHSSSTESGDLWVVQASGGSPTRLTWSASIDLEQKLREPKEVTISGADDTRIPALIYLPKYYREGERYPAIIWIRGGPAAASRLDFKPFYNWLANQGYVVVTPNYRGSTGYGVAHMLAVSGDGVGKHDLHDVLATAEYVKSLTSVDLSRGIGVGGHSWGGYLTLMAVTQAPEAFSCAVAGAAIADWRIQQSQTEVRYYDRWLMGGWIYDQAERAWERSPISGAGRIRVPLLVYHGEDDRDVPFAQIGPFVEEARRTGANVQYVTYSSERHSNRLPQNQQDTLDRIAAFYRRQLQPWNVQDNPSAGQVQY
jgi:dipeptidyl aminopeptidase/acylaminoacyl peptidase